MITFNDSTNIVHYTLSDDERRWKKKCYKQCQILGTKKRIHLKNAFQEKINMTIEKEN